MILLTERALLHHCNSFLFLPAVVAAGCLRSPPPLAHWRFGLGALASNAVGRVARGAPQAPAALRAGPGRRRRGAPVRLCPRSAAGGRAARRRPGIGGRGQAPRGKAKKVNHVQRAAEPSPPAEEEEPVEGLYSIAASQASSMGETKCHIPVDFIAPPKGKLRNIYGLAGIWDSGQLTSNHVVMGSELFWSLFGKHVVLDPYNGVQVEGASGNPLRIEGQVKIGLAISGLSELQPQIIDMMICNSVGRQFLLGRKLMNDWNVSIHYQDRRETWQAGEQTVSALNRHEAVEYHRGFYAGMFRSKKGERDTGKKPSTLVNPKRVDSKHYW